MDDYISRGQYDADLKRLEAEDHRQNERLEVLDKKMENNTQLTISVKELATNMSGLQKEQIKQGERLEALEDRDGEKWREFIKILLSALVGGVIGFSLKYIGIF